jgi:isocitrate/isopropylmalate dehydrogenase
MAKYRVAWLPGDGIGVDVLQAARTVLDWLGETGESSRLEEAVAAVIREGKVRTYDMGGSSTTMEMAAEIAHKLSAARGAGAGA